MSLADLTTPMTVSEASTTIYAALAARGVDVTVWKAGSPLRTLIAGLAIILAAFSALQAKIAASGFLLLSSGAWLTLVARYVYNVERDPGSFATGTITFTNAGGGVFSYGPDAIVVSNGTKTYRNTASLSLGSMGTATIAFRADELGSSSNATVGTITTLVTTMTAVTVSNPTAFVGSDEEDDATLRLRCAEKLGTLSPNGPRDAYAFVARSTKRTDGSSIGVTRVRTIADGAGGLDVYLADGDGGLADPADVTTIDDALQTQVVPLAVTCRTHAAATLSIDVTYELWIPSTNTQTDDEVKAAVEAGLADFIGGRDIGGDVISPATGKVYLSALEDVVGGVVEGTIKRAVTVPAGDTSVASTEAPAVGTVTCTAIHRIAGSLI